MNHAATPRSTTLFGIIRECTSITLAHIRAQPNAQRAHHCTMPTTRHLSRKTPIKACSPCDWYHAKAASEIKRIDAGGPKAFPKPARDAAIANRHHRRRRSGSISRKPCRSLSQQRKKFVRNPNVNIQSPSKSRQNFAARRPGRGRGSGRNSIQLVFKRYASRKPKYPKA